LKIESAFFPFPPLRRRWTSSSFLCAILWFCSSCLFFFPPPLFPLRTQRDRDVTSLFFFFSPITPHGSFSPFSLLNPWMEHSAGPRPTSFFSFSLFPGLLKTGRGCFSLFPSEAAQEDFPFPFPPAPFLPQGRLGRPGRVSPLKVFFSPREKKQPMAPPPYQTSFATQEPGIFFSPLPPPHKKRDGGFSPFPFRGFFRSVNRSRFSFPRSRKRGSSFPLSRCSKVFPFFLWRRGGFFSPRTSVPIPFFLSPFSEKREGFSFPSGEPFSTFEFRRRPKNRGQRSFFSRL